MLTFMRRDGRGLENFFSQSHSVVCLIGVASYGCTAGQKLDFLEMIDRLSDTSTAALV